MLSKNIFHGRYRVRSEYIQSDLPFKPLLLRIHWPYVWHWTKRHDTGRVDVWMAPVVVLLDMLEVGCILERGVVPVKVPHPLVDMRVPITDRPGIALEVTVINRVEAHDRRVEPDVCFGELVTNEEGRFCCVLRGEYGLDAIERGKELVEGGFVRALF